MQGTDEESGNIVIVGGHKAGKSSYMVSLVLYYGERGGERIIDISHRNGKDPLEGFIIKIKKYERQRADRAEPEEIDIKTKVLPRLKQGLYPETTSPKDCDEIEFLITTPGGAGSQVIIKTRDMQGSIMASCTRHFKNNNFSKKDFIDHWTQDKITEAQDYSDPTMVENAAIIEQKEYLGPTNKCPPYKYAKDFMTLLNDANGYLFLYDSLAEKTIGTYQKQMLATMLDLSKETKKPIVVTITKNDRLKIPYQDSYKWLKKKLPKTLEHHYDTLTPVDVFSCYAIEGEYEGDDMKVKWTHDSLHGENIGEPIKALMDRIVGER